MKKGNITLITGILILLTSCGGNTNISTPNNAINEDNYQEAVTEVVETVIPEEEIRTGISYDSLPLEELKIAMESGTTTTEDFGSEGEDIKITISTNTFVFLNEDVITDTITINENEIGGFQKEVGTNIEYIKTDGSNVDFQVTSTKGTFNYTYDTKSGTNAATLVSE